MAYKWCAVPKCTNTSIKTPEKLFVSVPRNADLRKKWLRMARRDPKEIRAASTIFFCEDHFEMEKDIRNYMQYKMGLSVKLLIVDGVVPSKFACQLDQNRLCHPSSSRDATIKRKRLKFNQECVEEPSSILSNTTVSINHIDVNGLRKAVISEYIKPSKTRDIGVNTEAITTAEKSVQLSWMHYRSKDTPTRTLTKDVSISSHKFSTSEQPLNQALKQPANTNCLIIPKKEILNDPENTFEDGCKDDTDFIIPKEELSNSSLHLNHEDLLECNIKLLKPIKTELIFSDNMVQVRQDEAKTHNEAIQNPHVSIQHNVTEMKLKPDVGASVSGYYVQTPEKQITKFPKQNMKDLTTEHLIVPKKEIFEDLEITFQNEYDDNNDFIIPKQELSNSSLLVDYEDQLENDMELLKPVMTELVTSEGMFEVLHQDSTHTQATQNQYVCVQRNATQVKKGNGISVMSARRCTSNLSRRTRDAMKARSARGRESSEKREARLSKDRYRHRLLRARRSLARLLYKEIKEILP